MQTLPHNNFDGVESIDHGKVEIKRSKYDSYICKISSPLVHFNPSIHGLQL